MTIKGVRSLLPLLLLVGALLVFAETTTAQRPSQTPTLPSERPEKLEPTNYGFDYVRREVMIPMRDGVKLHTVILVPKGAKNAPILLTRGGVVRRARQENGRVFGTFGNQDHGMQLNAVAHWDHYFTANIIKSIIRWFKLLRPLAWQ